MKNLLGHRDYYTQRNIRDTIKTSVNYSGEDVDLAELFYFFETSKQKTWLVATEKRVYIILDDIRKENVKVNKSYRIERVFSNSKLNIIIDPNYKTLFGRIFFLKATRGWLYSKKLYPSVEELNTKIESIIKRVSE